MESPGRLVNGGVDSQGEGKDPQTIFFLTIFFPLLLLT